MARLYLDDIRSPKRDLDFDVVRSYDQFVNYILKNTMPTMISFDHDLANEHYNDYYGSAWHKDPADIVLDYANYREKTGKDAADFLIRFCMNNGVRLPPCTVHSKNTVGGENIISVLNNYLKHVEDRPPIVKFFYWTTDKTTDTLV